MKRNKKTASRILSFVLSFIMVCSTFMTDYAIANASELIEETSESAPEVEETSDVEESSEEAAESEDTEAVEGEAEGEDTEATESEAVGKDAEATESDVEDEDAEATEGEAEGEDTEATEGEEVVEGEEELTEEELLEEEIVEILEEKIKISFKASEGGSVSMSEQELGEEDEVEAVTATADEGYEFVNWTKDGEEVSTSEEFTPAKEEATYVANFEEVEEEELEFNQSVELDGMKISLYAKPGVLPNDAELQVEKVSSTLEKEIKETIDSETEGTVEETISFDINIYSASAGTYVQPEDGTVSVTFELLNVDTEDKEVSVYHVEENGSSVSAVEEVSAPVENADEVAFEAEHFSVYTVTITTKNAKFYFYVNQVDVTGDKHEIINGEMEVEFSNANQVSLSGLKEKIETPDGYTYDGKAYVTVNGEETEIKRLRYKDGDVEYSTKENGNREKDWSDLDYKRVCFHYTAIATEKEITVLHMDENHQSVYANQTVTIGEDAANVNTLVQTIEGYKFENAYVEVTEGTGWNATKVEKQITALRFTDSSLQYRVVGSDEWNDLDSEEVCLHYTKLPTPGNIVFKYYAEKNVNDNVSAPARDMIKYTIDLVDENGKSVSNASFPAGTNIPGTITFDQGELSITASTFDEVVIPGYTFDDAYCFFYWNGNYQGTKKAVTVFRNFGQLSDDYSGRNGKTLYDSYIGFKAPEQGVGDDYNQSFSDANGYYAYNPTGTLRVVFKKITEENPPKTLYISNGKVVGTYTDTEKKLENRAYVYKPVNKLAELDADYMNVSAFKPGDDYTFVGWCADKEYVGTLDGQIVDDSFFDKYVNTDVKLYAKWVKHNYKVEHYQQNVSGQGYTLKETEFLNGTAGQSVTPLVKSYEGFEEPSRQTVTVAADGSTVVKYYYTRKQYKVTLNIGDGISSTSGAGTYYYGEQVTVNAVVKDDTTEYTYEWEKWTGDETSTKQKYTFTMPAKDVELTANGTQTVNSYKQIVQVRYENADGTFTEYKDVINANYTYGSKVEWSSGETTEYQASEKVSYTVTGEKETQVTVYRNTYTVTLNKGTGISEVTQSGNGTYRVGQSVTVDASLLDNTAQYTYGWEKWTGDFTSEEQSYTFTMPANNVTLKANGIQTVNAYRQIVKVRYENADGSFTAYSTVIDKDYNYGEEVTWARRADETYKAAAIKEYNVEGPKETEVTVYRKTYTVTLNKGTGISEVTQSGNGTYRVGQTVKVTATLSDNTVEKSYAWANWTGDIASTNQTYEFEMPAKNVVLTANATGTTNTYNQVVMVRYQDENGNYGNTYEQAWSADVEYGKQVSWSREADATFEAASITSYTVNGKKTSYVDVPRKQYKVTLEAGTGIEEVTGAKEYYVGQSVTVDATMKVNTDQFTYEWVNWTGRGVEGSTEKTYTFKMPANNVELTANGTETTNQYLQVVQVRYQNADGTLGNYTDVVNGNFAYGTEISWSREADEIYQAASIETYSVTGAKTTQVTVYRNTYTVTLNKGTGISEVTQSGNGTYRVGQTVKVTATLSDNTVEKSYAWANWTGDIASTNQTYEFEMPAKNVVLTANATGTTNTYNQVVMVSYQDENGNYGAYEKEMDEKVAYGNTVSWSRAADATFEAASITSYTVTGEKTSYVDVPRKQFEVTLNKGTGIAEVTGAGTYYAGQDVAITATVLPGYKWSKWASGKTKEYTIDSITSDVVDTAYATPEAYEISYDLAGGILEEGKTNRTSYTVETDTFTLNNPTRTGYTFVGWTGTDLSEATDVVTITKGSTGHRTYTATWTAIEYTVTYQLNGGSVDGKTEDVVYEKLIYGQSYAENAPAPNVTRTGQDGVTYFFDGWKAGENFVDLNGKTVTGNATYTAQWVEAQLIATGEDVTYDGAFHGIAVVKSDNVTITGYEVNGTTSANAPTYKNVSDNTITVKGSVTLSNGDVKAVTDTATVKISPRPITVQLPSVTMNYSELMGRSIAVDDIKAPGFDVTAGELVTGDEIIATLAVEDGIDGVNKEQGAITLAKDSGIIIKSADDDVSANYAVTVKNGLAQVTDTTKTVITLTANSGKYTYNAKEQTVSGYTATIAGKTLENYTVSGVTAIANGTNAGEYDVTFSYDNGGFKVTDKAGKDVTKYFSIETVNGKLTIDKANLTITAKSAEKAYDGTELQGGYSVEGLQGTDTVTSIEYKKAWSWEDVRVAPSITTPGTVNYSVQNAVISNGRTANYNITYVDGTLKVTKADIAITVKANDNTATYDGSAHVAKLVNGKQYSITSGNLLPGDYIIGAVSGSARDVNDNGITTVEGVRIYHGNWVDVTNCYNITTETGNITINKRPITITVNSATKVYDGTELLAPVDESTGKAYKITSGSLAGYYVSNFGFTDVITTADVTGSILYPGTVNSTIDKTAIKIGVESDSIFGGVLDTIFGYILNRTNLESNYDITVVDGTLTITKPEKVALTITANGNSKVYDGTPLKAAVGKDEKAYTVSGELYPNHVLEAKVAGERTNAGGAGYKESIVSEYTIKCGDRDVSEFYTVTKVASDLTVSQRPIQVVANNATKAVYDGIPFTTDDMLDENGVGFDVLAVEGNADSGLLYGHTVTAEISVDENLTVSRDEATHVANAKVVESDVMLLSEESSPENYAITYVDGNAVVNAENKLDVTLTANSGTYTYTGGEFAVDGYTVTGPEGFDVTGLTFDNVAAGAKATTVGSYAVSFAYTDTEGNELTEANVAITDAFGNNVTEYFTITYVDGILRINAQPTGGGGGGTSGGGGGRSTADVGRVLGARREDIAVFAEEGQVLGAVRAPKTSDSSRAILWMLVMGTSALGAAAILAQKKNEEEN